VLGDERGFFVETYRRSVFEDLGIRGEFVQDNHSRSSKGIVRGMHFQVARGAAKLVRCGRGTIIDVLLARTSLVTARAESIQARWEWRTALAQLAHDIGALDVTGRPNVPLTPP